MKKKQGFFQFFYASKKDDLPCPDIPTRDVTNTCKAGHKTEPHLEKHMENWCPCRARYVRVRVREAQNLHQLGGQHYMILTTNHPENRTGYAVGILVFSKKAYDSVRNRYPNRWKDYLPYVGSAESKLVSFEDAFHLRQRRLPGKRCGIVNAHDKLLRQIIDHFQTKKDQTDKFLKNVRHLEHWLKKNRPKDWKRYRQRKAGVGNCKKI